jgi:hypothetical protein
MTAKEKAQELVTKFRKYASGDDDDYRFSPAIEKENAKLCALIAVNEVINNDVGYNAYDGVTDSDIWIDKEYWQEVKQEIHKL